MEKVGLGRKRNRESKQGSDVKETYGLTRDMKDDDYKVKLCNDYYFDPPNIARLLEFFVDLENSNIDKLTTAIKNSYSEGQLEETENNAQQLAKMIKGDPRLGKFLKMDFLHLLVVFLTNQQNLTLQLHAATIIQHSVAYSTNNQVFKQSITPSIILTLLSSKHRNLQFQFESVVLALKDLILYKCEQTLTAIFLPSACSALAYLCDGRGMMVLKDHLFGEIIDRLIVLIDSDSIINCNSGLTALGRIVRWASDYHIQLMIEKGVLWSVEWSIRQDEKFCVMYACWIISNITAREGNFIQDVVRCDCIGSLVDVVQNFKFLEPKREAAWAIMNAIHGASIDQIELFRTSCVKALWNVPTVFSDDLDMVFACLEVLAKLEVVTVTCNGKLIDNVQFQKYLVTLLGRRFQLVNDIDGLPKSKKLRTTDNLGKYDGDMEFLITCTYEEDMDLQQPVAPIISIVDGNIRLDSATIAADPKGVEEPRS